MKIRKTGRLARPLFLAIAALCAAAPLMPGSAHSAPNSPFVAAGAGVWTGDGTPVIAEVFLTDSASPLVVETGSLPTAYGKFRGAYGSNGFDMQTTGGIDREVDGGSIWTDGFTVTGADGLLALSTRIRGTVSGHGEMAYALFVSSDPFDFDVIRATVSAADGFWAVQLPNADRVLFTGVANRCGQVGASDECGHVPYDNFQGALDVTLGASVPFASGQTVYVASLFAGGVGVFGGSESFYNSADFGITAPPGAAIASLSGSPYAPAVPEPSTVLLLLGGLGLLAAGGARRGERRVG